METLLTIIFSILLIIILATLFIPVLKGRQRSLLYFTSGSSRKSDLLLEKHFTTESIRDIQMEKENGKLTEEEFHNLVLPLAEKLNAINEDLKNFVDSSEQRNSRRNRLGVICGACGHLNRDSDADEICEQCGYTLSGFESTDTIFPDSNTLKSNQTEAKKTSNGNSIVLYLLVGLAGLLTLPIFSSLNDSRMTALQAQSEKVTIRGRITNATTGQPAIVESLELLSLGSDGMQAIETQENTGPIFSFSPVEPGENPYLVRATYDDEAYVHVVRPDPDSMRNEVNLQVYETGVDLAGIHLTRAIQVTRLRNSLRISRFYVIENTANRSISGEDFEIFIPDEATDIYGQIVHESTRMPLPITFEEQTEGRRTLSRSLRPGNTEVTVNFEVPGHRLQEEFTMSSESPDRTHDFLILIWQPDDARPEIKGAQYEEVEIPNLGKAYRIAYPASGKLAMDFSSGSIFIDNPLAADENPIFNTPGKTIFAVIAFLLIFLVIISILAGTGLRLVKQ